MALNSATVFEVRATGSDTNGGGFKTGATGTDWSQQDAAQYAVTDAITAGTTTITSATANFGTDVVGNVAYVTGGTGSVAANLYQIATRVNSTTITVDRSTGLTAGTGVTVNIGGAIKNIDVNSFFSNVVAGNKVWIKKGTYTGSVDIASVPDATALLPITFEGYNTVRGDAPPATNRPTLARGAFAFQAGQYNVYKNLIITSSNSIGLRSANGSSFFYSLKISNSANSATSSAISPGGNDLLLNCEFTNPGGRIIGGLSGGYSINSCYIHDGAKGIYTQFQNVFNSVFAGCTTSCANPAGGGVFNNCTFYGAETPSGIGLDLSDSTADSVSWTNCIFYGLATAVNNDANRLVYGANNNFFNNTTNRTNVNAMPGDIALNPTFTNAASGDFSIGTNLKAGGIPGTFPGALSTGYIDIGAIQRQENYPLTSQVLSGVVYGAGTGTLVAGGGGGLASMMLALG